MGVGAGFDRVRFATDPGPVSTLSIDIQDRDNLIRDRDNRNFRSLVRVGLPSQGNKLTTERGYHFSLMEAGIPLRSCAG
jgi:hypothetical protein